MQEGDKGLNLCVLFVYDAILEQRVDYIEVSLLHVVILFVYTECLRPPASASVQPARVSCPYGIHIFAAVRAGKQEINGVLQTTSANIVHGGLRLCGRNGGALSIAVRGIRKPGKLSHLHVRYVS